MFETCRREVEVFERDHSRGSKFSDILLEARGVSDQDDDAAVGVEVLARGGPDVLWSERVNPLRKAVPVVEREIVKQQIEELCSNSLRGLEFKRQVSNQVAFGAVELVPCDRMVVERSEEHTSELQSRSDLVCRLLLEKKKKIYA